MNINPVVERIGRQSLVENAAEQLRLSIEFGRLVPGTRLLETEIADQLGVSRGTLREAFRILENEGIIESIPGRGSYIKALSERDIKELYLLRSILEQEAVRQAAQNISEIQIDELKIILDKMFTYAKKGDLIEVVSCDLDFHKYIWEIADNHLLKQVLEGFSLQVKLYLAVQTKLYQDLSSGIADHEVILEAIQDHDCNRAAVLMRSHLESAANTVVDYAHQQDVEGKN